MFLLTKQSFNGCSWQEIRTLISLFDFFGVLGSLLSFLIDTINLGEAALAKRTCIFTLGPFFDTSKAKTMVTTIDLSKVIWLDVTHANAAVLGGIRLGCWLLFVLLSLDGGWRGLQAGGRRFETS
jgi:hypothetical protein